MRDVPESIAAQLAAGVTTLAHVWRFERRDGAVFGFTDHDQPFSFNGVTCEPLAALQAGLLEKSLALNPDTASVAGVLTSDAITESDLARGLWDGAHVTLYRVDWTDPNAGVHLFAGRLGEVRRGAQAFEAEMRGLQAQLNMPLGRVFSRFCDAALGDARCGKVINAPAFSGQGSVVSVQSETVFRASGLTSFGAGFFARGRLAWDDGGESEVVVDAHQDELTLIELRAPAPSLAPGAAFTIYAGCDKRFATCVEKFANGHNFRGVPHMPGNDAVQARPSAGQIMDGGSRFR